MVWEMMTTFLSASKGVGGWSILFFSSTKNWVKGIRDGVIHFLNYEFAAFLHAKNQYDIYYTLYLSIRDVQSL